MDTNFYMPVQVRMGRDIVEKSGALLAGMGRRAMLVTGRSSAVKCGAQADVTAALEKNGQRIYWEIHCFEESIEQFIGQVLN